ncbi:MAG: GNAT family N-acetyltransferase [Proteobacteria bacterium]|nr:GNAT family N-acetyltransferase [Pseudomonadota bacterium]MBU1737960.1 GNAT family N-acetyltransferase [Pseudomonadota bacterium]
MNIVGEIKWYLNEDYARLQFSESSSAFSIDTVMVPANHRGEGIGKALINHVLIMADRMGKMVRVSARPIGECSEERLQRLVSYYEKFGFRIEDRGHSIAYMVREVVRDSECYGAGS